jgi:hypothetical protein
MVLSMAQMGNDGTLWSIDASAGLAQCYVGDGRWQANTNRKMKAVSCASAAQVWGVDANGKACVLTSSPVQSSSTSAQRLAVGGPAGPLWVYAGSITWTDSAGKTGTVPAPSVEFTSFAATDPAKGGYALWGTTADYSPKPPKLSALFWDGSAWKDSGGPGFNAISIGLDNSVWGYFAGTGASGPGLYSFNSQGQWALAVKLPAAAAAPLQSFAVVQPYSIWAVDSNSKLYHWNGQVWMPQAAGSPTWIRCGADGAVYGRNTLLGTQAGVLRFNGFAQWVPMPVTFSNLIDLASRNAGALWFSHWADRLSVMGSWPGAVWQDMGSAVLATISGAPDGTVWGTDGNNALLRFNGTSWDTMPGQAKQVSVGSSTLVWSIDVNGNAQRWTGSAWEAHGNPGAALTSIAALGDGTVLGTATVTLNGVGQPTTMGEVFTWDGKTWTATGMLADQLAGTDAAHLAGVTRGPNGTGGDLVFYNPSPAPLVPDTMTNVGFAPPNPVYPGTVMTLSWDAYPGAVAYEARINSAAKGYEVQVTDTSISYTLVRGDMFSNMGGWVHALDGSGAIVAQGTASYYCGNNQG